jgi:hypothetical protein
MTIVNTGANGGLMFSFLYVPDSIGLLTAPRRYQRAEIAYGEASIAAAIVADVTPAEDGDGWVLLLSVGLTSANEVADEINAGRELAVRVIG